MSTKFNPYNRVPVEQTPRNTFNLSYSHKTSINMGRLYPLMCNDMLPGDKFTITPELLIRYAPMLFPVYQQMNATLDFFYVPNRIMWTDWKDFIAGNLDPLGDAYVPPYLKLDDGALAFNVAVHSIWDYLGFPLGDIHKDEQILAFPLIAYLMIYNEYYQDQNNDELYPKLKEKLKQIVNKGGQIQPSDLFPSETGITNWDQVYCFLKAWQHDYFTSALPFAQKGPAVGIPVELVELIATTSVNKVQRIGDDAPIVGDITSTTVGSDAVTNVGSDLVKISGTTIVDPGDAQLVGTINDLRYNMALQKFYEMNARSGTRYNEFIEEAFQVDIGDARINRPEFLQRIQNNVMISEVLQTSSTNGDSALGQYAGYGNALVGGNTVHHFAPEHGWLICIVSVTPTTGYMQGLPRKYTKMLQLDYPFKQFMHTGEQSILNKELYYDKDDGLNNDEFGYIPYASEYKTNQDMVSSEFRTTLLPFTLARNFATRPQLNSEFIYVQPEPQKRIFAVTEGNVDSLYVNLIFNIKANRPVSYFSEPR